MEGTVAIVDKGMRECDAVDNVEEGGFPWPIYSAGSCLHCTTLVISCNTLGEDISRSCGTSRISHRPSSTNSSLLFYRIQEA